MAEDQEWCLECGAARTVIARPPDWRLPMLVIGVVVVLIVGGFVCALTRIDHNAGRVTVVSPSAARQTPQRAALAGWTVVLASATTESAADAQARRLQSKEVGLGVLSTRQHPQMTPQGEWDVFHGRYSSYALATAAAAKADHSGQPQARPALVQRPGT